MVTVDTVHEELNSLDRNALIDSMVKELPFISSEMGMTPVGIASRTGIDSTRMKLMVAGKRKMKWSEYMSILFVLWDDERGRELAESAGLFPNALKNAMSINSSQIEEDRGIKGDFF